MNPLVYISCVFAATSLAVDGSPRHCSKDCDCINHCVDGEIGLCNNNSCNCESCKDDSNDGDSDSDDEDGAVHTHWTSCTNDRDCKCVSCPKNEIGFCKDDSDAGNKEMCRCKSCANNESSEDDGSDDSSSSHNVAGYLDSLDQRHLMKLPVL